MKYPCLVTTDIHLTDHPSTEYRWELFPWINQQVKEHGVKSILMLGDITDAKDNHSNALINRITDSIRALHCDDVKIIAGNHDWLLKGQEALRFLNHIPGLQFITRPTEDSTVAYGEQCIYLPFSKAPGKEWEAIDWANYDYAFMHQTVTGALASNGQRMEGEGVPAMGVRKRVYSGDIHVPQTIGNCTYIGSPYQVHFGDDFEPRVLILERGGKEKWLRMPSPRRIVLKVQGLEELGRKLHDLQEADQVKLRMVLSAADKHQWLAIKRKAVAMLEEGGIIVHGAELMLGQETSRLETERAVRASKSPKEMLLGYVEREELGGAIYDAGMDIMEAA